MFLPTMKSINGYMKWKQTFEKFLTQAVDGHTLGLFRLLFGLCMAYETINYFQIDLVKNAYFLTQVHLTYDCFEWLRPLPEPLMNGLLAVMLLCALLIAGGLLFRPACFLFSGIYLYFFLLEKSLYNNHIYLFILLSFLLGFTQADRFLSLRNLLQKSKAQKPTLLQWEVFILQLQIAIVYFYGGLAKLNFDWLVKMEPMKGLVHAASANPLMAGMVGRDFIVPLLTYGGLAFDLAIPFLLWNRFTRKWLIVPIVCFHLANSHVFNDIGIFPIVMIFVTVLFFQASEIPWFRNLSKMQSGGKKSKNLQRSRVVYLTLIAFFIFQFSFPFRGFFLPNSVVWTGVGNCFAWHMKIQSRVVHELQFYVQDGPDAPKQRVEINTFCNPMQVLTIANDVKSVVETSRMLEVEMKRRGGKAPMVTANIKVKWNGRIDSFTVRPEIDLSKINYSPFRKLDWVMPVPE